MTDRPLVSVVIPTYNRATLLRKALQSIVNQTMPDWEVLVVDDHSDDDTDDVVLSFGDPRIRLVKAHSHRVIAASRNRGIQEARGAYVAFLDADDWWTPRKLEIATKVLGDGCDICFHDMWLVKGHRPRLLFRRVSSRRVTSPVYSDLIRFGNALPNSSVVVRTELLRAVGGLSEDPELVASEDFDCWLRLARITERFCRLPGVHGYYLHHTGNTTNSRRSIMHLQRLRDLHLGGHASAEHADRPLWYEYGMARAVYLTGDRKEALRLLCRVVTRRASLSIRCKSAFMLLMSLAAGRGPSGERDA